MIPTANAITFNGAVVAAGTHPVRTDGTGVSTMALEVQTSQAIPITDATKIGLAAFNNADFTVDANGFVSLVGTGGAPIQTITGNTGGPEVPSGGNFNIVGTGSITVAGSANTETVQLTGLTLNAIQVGAGTATLTQLGPTNNAVLTTGATGIPALTSLASNGQLIIGSGSGAPAAATLTAGSGITITNGANSITIANTNPSGFPWVDATGATQALAVNTGYITDHSATVVYTLPATAALGDTIKIVGKLGLATITPNANQQIDIGSTAGTVGVTGTAVSTNVGDCIELICITAGASCVFRAASIVGTWTLT